MSEEEKGAAAPEASTQPQIMIQRVYLKDLSFESPNAPQSFTAEWKPEVGVDLNSQARQFTYHHYGYGRRKDSLLNGSAASGFIPHC
jgi:preprotein translocase subunit SecB